MFTGHKVTGPTGIGVLWGRRELFEQLPPFLGGGEMIATVAMEQSTYAGIPHKFEAGTPPIVEAVGLGAALDYLAAVGMENVRAHEEAITGYALDGLASVIGPDRDGSARRGAARWRDLVRAGRRAPARRRPRCSTPAASPYGPGTTAPSRRTSVSESQSSTRASSYLYTTPAEVDALDRGAGVHQEVLPGG